MASANAWLQKQRKSDLVDMADHVGMRSVQRLAKADLQTALEEHLRANSSTLSNDPRVAPFFQGVDPSSPVKHNPSITTPEERKPRQRRQTIKAREELLDAASDTDPTTALAPTRTPKRPLELARQVPLPPSPAVLADQIDAQTTTLRTSLNSYVANSPLPSSLDYIRSTLSTVTSIELLTLFIEAWGLRGEVLPLRPLTTTPAVPALGIGQVGISVPDFFALLTMAFWGPFGLWVATSIMLPSLAGYFINLRGDGGYDAVSFNAAKALVAWIVYIRGGVGGKSRVKVANAVPGGSAGMLIGAGIGGLAGLYEAMLRK